MQDKRKRILAMLENGTISMDEALTLLEQLETTETKQQTLQSPNQRQEETDKSSEEKQEHQNDYSFFEEESRSMDDFLNDLRTEFNQVGNRFMNLMQSTVKKVKDFDFESPFGQFGHSVTFNKTLTADVTDLEEIDINIENGKVIIHETIGEEIRAEFFVKAYNHNSVEDAIEIFQNEVVFIMDSGKLKLSSSLKMMNVEVELFVPQKTFEKLRVKLLNGSFSMKDFEVKKLKVKTVNGKIEVKHLTFKSADLATTNGSIELKNSKGDKVEAETLNGKVYIDGQFIATSAKSLNGTLAITTNHPEANYIEAKTVSGQVELYVPANRSLQGELATNVGKLKVHLDDIHQISEQEQLLQKSAHFQKKVDGDERPIRITGETKTGTVFVYYNPINAQ